MADTLNLGHDFPLFFVVRKSGKGFRVGVTSYTKQYGTQQPSRANVQLMVQELYSCFGSNSPIADCFKYNSGQRRGCQIMQGFALKKIAGQTRLAGFSPSV